jgi:CP family cyanate transporter-like MFS transporter
MAAMKSQQTNLDEAGVPAGAKQRNRGSEHRAHAEPRPIPAPIAIGAMIVVALSLRPAIVTVGPVLPSVIAEFGLNHTAASLLTAIPDILMGVLALPTPWLARKYGRDPVLIAALLVLTLATAGRAFSTGRFALMSTTVGVGAGIAVTGTLIAGFIKARFPSKAAALMGVYATSLSLGSTLSAAVTGPVAAGHGWRLAAGMWAIGSLAAIFAWIVVAMVETEKHAPVPVAEPSVGLPWRNGTAWLVAGFFACNNFLFYSLLAWLSPLYREYGMSPAKSGLVLASFTFVFMLGNPIFGWLTRREDRRGWLALSSVLALAGLVPTALAPTLAPFLFIPIAAFGMGGAFTLAMTLPLDNTKSVSEANVWNALMLLFGYLVAATGPILVGLLRDVTGRFDASLWLIVVSCCRFHGHEVKLLAPAARSPLG